jgi:hypothetical protein
MMQPMPTSMGFVREFAGHGQNNVLHLSLPSNDQRRSKLSCFPACSGISQTSLQSSPLTCAKYFRPFRGQGNALDIRAAVRVACGIPAKRASATGEANGSSRFDGMRRSMSVSPRLREEEFKHHGKQALTSRPHPRRQALSPSVVGAGFRSLSHRVSRAFNGSRIGFGRRT